MKKNTDSGVTNLDSSSVSISNNGVTAVAEAPQQKQVNVKIKYPAGFQGRKYFPEGEVRTGVSVEVANSLVEQGIGTIVSDDEATKAINASIQKRRQLAQDAQKTTRNSKPYSEWSKEELVEELESKTTPRRVGQPSVLDQTMTVDSINTAASVPPSTHAINSTSADASNTPSTTEAGKTADGNVIEPGMTIDPAMSADKQKAGRTNEGITKEVIPDANKGAANKAGTVNKGGSKAGTANKGGGKK